MEFDAKRRINKWDVYHVNLTSRGFDDSLFHKVRPAIIFQSIETYPTQCDSVNRCIKNKKNNIYCIPIITVNLYNNKTFEQWANQSNFIAVPITIEKGHMSAVIINQMRPINTNQINSRYYGYINDLELRHKIQEKIVTYLLDDDFIENKFNVNQHIEEYEYNQGGIEYEETVEQEEKKIVMPVKREKLIIIKRKPVLRKQVCEEIPDDFELYYDAWIQNEKSIDELSKLLSISSKVCYQWIRKYRSDIASGVITKNKNVDKKEIMVC